MIGGRLGGGQLLATGRDRQQMSMILFAVEPGSTTEAGL